jgi:hypothetical protein
MPVFKTLRKSIPVDVPAKLGIGTEKLLFCVIVISRICSVYLMASSADSPIRDIIAGESANAKAPTPAVYVIALSPISEFASCNIWEMEAILDST